MNICFGFKVWPSLFCYRFDIIGPCWSEVSIPVLDFYVALGENIVVGSETEECLEISWW